MSFDTRAEYAVAASNRGEFATAKEVVIDLVSEDWHNAAAHRAWGQLLLNEGKPSDAAAAFRVAVDLDPRQGAVHFDLAAALFAEAEASPYLRLTNWVELRAAVQEGLDRAPDSERGLMLLASVESLRSNAV